MKRLLAPIAAMTVLVVSTADVVADPAGLGPEFTGRLEFGPCEPDQSHELGCGEPRVVELFSDSRHEGGVAITAWSGGYDPTSEIAS